MPVKLKYYEYKSALSTHIIGLVSEKRELGYIYNNEAGILKHLDDYWINNQFSDSEFTSNRLECWCQKTKTEQNKSLSNRIVVTRQLSFYIQSLGFSAYLPENNIKVEKPLIHILCSQEVQELFAQFDARIIVKNDPANIRLNKAYCIYFRLILCAGLRRTESCLLKVSDFNLKEKCLKITEAKNDKHRIVYLSDDVADMLIKHIEETKHILGYTPEWMFPGYDPSKPINSGTLSKRFNEAWSKTSFAGKVDKKPTLHSLRHTFVVMRIRQWESEGKSVNEMLPYLSKHLGHVCIDDTYYYYQRIQESLEHVRKKDTVSNLVIPEVLPR